MTMNWTTLLRLYTMIGAVTGVSLIVFSSLFTATSFAIAVVAVGTIALVSAILGFVLAFVSAEGEPLATDAEMDASQLPGWRPEQGN